MRIAAVLWSGLIGGAETFTADLCRAMRGLGVEPGIVFVTSVEPLSERLDADAIAHTSLELSRGREVIRHPRALANAVQEFGPDGALLIGGGYLAAALRIGGYRGRVVAVMHGATIELGPLTFRDRVVWRIDRTSGSWASDVDVAVSDFALSRIRNERRRGQLIRIYNGVDLAVYEGSSTVKDGGEVTIGYGGRLIDGKGVDVLLRAFAAGPAREGVRLRIGGDGAARPALEHLAADLHINDLVDFVGWKADMPSFWRSCDVAAMPSDRCIESFGMAAVEAMACATPVVVSNNGALPELVADRVTGFVVPPADPQALADALLTLTRDAARRRAAAEAARARCEERFDIRDCAASYIRLFRSDVAGLGGDGSPVSLR